MFIIYKVCIDDSVMPEVGGQGGHVLAKNLGYKLTLFGPRGAGYAWHITTGSQSFGTIRRLWSNHTNGGPLYLHIIFPMMFIDFSKKLDSQERHLLTILKALLLSSLKK